jgi:manganese transport protein
MAIGINLLSDIPYRRVMITVLDTFLLLFLINKGIRKMEVYHYFCMVSGALFSK